MQNSSDRWIKPLTLSGQHVTLEPLEMEHAAALADAARDGMLWKLWFTTVPSPEQSDEYVSKAVAGLKVLFALRLGKYPRWRF